MIKMRVDAEFDYASGYSTVARNFVERIHEKHTDKIDLNISRMNNPQYLKIDWIHGVTKKKDITQKVDHALMWTTPNTRVAYMKEPNAFPMWKDTKSFHYFVWELNKIPQLWSTLLEDIKTDAIFTASNFSKDAIEASVDLPVHVVPHGFDNKTYRKKDKIKKRSKFVALYVGSWDKRKAPLETVLSMVNALHDTDSEIWIKINYDEQTTKQLKRSIQTSVVRSFPNMKNIPKIYIFNNYMTEKEMNNMYNKADIVVSASRGEAWNMPLFEAIATKTPVITTDKGGHMDYINKNYTFLSKTRGLTLSAGDGVYDSNNGLKWLDVDFEHTSKLLKDAYDLWLSDKEKLDEHAEILYQNIKHLTWDNAIDIYLNHVSQY